MMKLIRQADRLLGLVPEALVLLFVRVAVGHVFWASGRTKVDGWFTLRPEAVELFRSEYKVPFPELMAPVAATMEHLLPVLLVLGLFTRFAALGLVGMTLFIQLFVYPEAWWPVHSLWLALLLVVVTRGPGALALDARLTGLGK